MRSLYGQKTEEKHGCSQIICTILVIILFVVLFLGFFYAFHKSSKPLPITRRCVGSQPPPEYEGVASFFQYLEKPQHTCPKWKKLGGDRDAYDVEVSDFTGKDEIVTEIGTPSEYVCLTEQDDDVTGQSCIIYSFSQDDRAKSLQPLDCKFQSILREQNPFIRVNTLKRSSEDTTIKGMIDLLNESNIVIDRATVPAEDVPRRQPHGIMSRLASDEIVFAPGRQEEVKLAKVDAPGHEWVILRRIAFGDFQEFQQVSVNINIPVAVSRRSEIERRLYFADLHKVFQDLNCQGYKLIRSQPLSPDADDLILPELDNRGVPSSYQVHLLKVNN